MRVTAKFLTRGFWKSRQIYRVLLFVFCIMILVQLLIILPMTIDDASSPVTTSSEPQEEEDASEAPTEGVPKELAGDQRMSRIHMLETREGRKDWELWSDQAKSLPEDQLVILSGVDSIFHGKEGVTYRVSGEKGVIEVPNKNLAVSGDVETKASNGYTFYTNDMQYSSKERVLSTQSQVRVEGPPAEGRRALKLTGRGLRTTLDESRVEVLHDVRAEKVLEKGQRAVIRSDRARFDGNKLTASFLGEVILDVDDMRITGPKADFLYDPRGDILKSVVFSGGTRVSDPTKWATSEQVKVDFVQNKYVFSGNPRVVQNSDELKGEQIIFHDGGKRIQVIGARAKIDRNRLEEAD